MSEELGPVDMCIEELLFLALDDTISERCTFAEATVIRAQLAEPDEVMSDLMTDAANAVVETLGETLPQVLNYALYRDGQTPEV